MGVITARLDRRGLIDYVAVAKEAKKEVRDLMKSVANAGRKEARQSISSQFRRRTGKLAKQARGIRTSVSVRTAEVSAMVGPLPNLSNIFEKGATIPAREISPKRAQAVRFMGGSGEAVFARGKVSMKGFALAARPTKAPALGRMVSVGETQAGLMLERIAQK